MDWRKHWVLLGHTHDTGSAQRIYRLLKSEGITPNEWSLYGTQREVIRAMGLSPDTSHVFHGSTYVGTEEALDTYLYTIKRQKGEI